MLRPIIVSSALAISILTASCVVSAQDTRTKTNDLVAQLDKTKHKVKDKRGTHTETYTEVRNEAAAMKPADLTGRYTSTDAGDFWIDLHVDADGTANATGTGFENVGANSVRVNYTFKGRIEGALLTGTRILENGRTEPFEAVFVNRTVREGTTPIGAAVTYKGFGIGYIQQDENSTNRVFLQKR